MIILFTELYIKRKLSNLTIRGGLPNVQKSNKTLIKDKGIYLALCFRTPRILLYLKFVAIYFNGTIFSNTIIINKADFTKFLMKHKSKYLCFFSNKLLPKIPSNALKNKYFCLKSTCVSPWICQYRICKDNLTKTRS